MKKYLLLLIPGLMILNACQGGKGGLSSDAQTLLNDSEVVSAIADEADKHDDGSTTLKSPTLDGSDLEGHTATPANPPAPTPEVHPGGWNGGEMQAVPNLTLQENNSGNSGNSGDTVQQVGPGFNFQKAEYGINPTKIVDPNHPNGYIQGYANDNDGVQAVPENKVTAELQPTVYDPFCNCYKTGPNDSSIGLSKDKPQLQNSGNSHSSIQATGSDEDDDD